MKILLLLLSIFTRLKPILGQTQATVDSTTKVADAPTGKFTDCFKTQCDATNFKMIINLNRACPQFADFKGLWLRIYLEQ